MIRAWCVERWARVKAASELEWAGWRRWIIMCMAYNRFVHHPVLILLNNVIMGGLMWYLSIGAGIVPPLCLYAESPQLRACTTALACVVGIVQLCKSMFTRVAVIALVVCLEAFVVGCLIPVALGIGHSIIVGNGSPHQKTL